jgi:hypothetical protein
MSVENFSMELHWVFFCRGVGWSTLPFGFILYQLGFPSFLISPLTRWTISMKPVGLTTIMGLIQTLKNPLPADGFSVAVYRRKIGQVQGLFILYNLFLPQWADLACSRLP